MDEKKVNNTLKRQSNELVKKIDAIHGKLPHLPENIREVLVKIAPWLSLVFGVLGVLTGLGVLGLSPLAMPGGIRVGMMVLLAGVLTIISSVLMLLAFPKLNKHAYAGWVFLFWSELVNVIYAVVAPSLGSVLSVLIGLYILFEIKRYYK